MIDSGIAERFWAKVSKEGPLPAHRPELGCCWLWTASTVRGYGQLKLQGIPAPARAHRVSADIHDILPLSDNRHVLHACDNTRCVNPGHLFVGTQADNMRDKQLKDRAGAKVTRAMVLEIRQRLADGEPTSSVAEMFGLSLTTVVRIRSRKVWSHV